MMIQWCECDTCIYIYIYTDVDECSDGSDDCDDKALCENTEGSHTCTCNQGYSGTGLICTGMYLTWHVYLTDDLHGYQ